MKFTGVKKKLTETIKSKTLRKTGKAQAQGRRGIQVHHIGKMMRSGNKNKWTKCRHIQVAIAADQAQNTDESRIQDVTAIRLGED